MALFVLLALGGSGCQSTVQGEGAGQSTDVATRTVRTAQALQEEEASWASTGGLALGRLLHTATLLPSGKVLVAGGFNRTAELYSPEAGTWSRTGDTLVSRRYHSLTPLADGRVLLAGGEDCRPSTSAEVYGPDTGSWVSTGALVTCRAHHAAVRLSSGKVLVVGGTDASGRTLSSSEVYDPATGAWASTGSLGTARANPTATLLPSGKVLVAGGDNGSVGRLASAEVYDPDTGSWTATGALRTARLFHTSTLLPSGRVLVTGGGGFESTPSTSCELYDPATGSWAATGSMGQPRRYHSATLLEDGKVLVAGGYHDYTGISSSSELYDTTTGSWSAAAPLKVNRYGHTATLLADGRVLAAAGFSTQDQASAEVYGTKAAEPSEPSGTSLLLEVVDSAGNPLSSAAISSGNAVFPTDSAGRLLFENLPSGRFFARVDALGFTSATVVRDVPEGAHVGARVRLLPLGTPIAFQAEQGGVINTPQVRVTLPPNSVVDALGQPVTGPVDVTVVPIDPTTQLALMPGPLEGITAADGQTLSLESAFMAEVSLWRNGAPVQLAPGASATLEFVLPDSTASKLQVGDTIPAWWFDLDAGLWREEGQGTIQPATSQPGKLSWVVTVSHFTWWNSDWVIPASDKSCVDVLVVDGYGWPLPNVQVMGWGANYAGISYPQYTGPDGRVCLEIKRGHTARVFVQGLSANEYSASVLVTGSDEATACGTGPCTPVTLTVEDIICTPGTYATCPYRGPAGTLDKGLCRAGRRQCNATGTKWSSCTGQVLPVPESCQTLFDDDCDGAENEGCTCSDRQGGACYTGPVSTLGVGICHPGVVACDLFGNVMCEAQQLPKAEDCLTPEDDDCNGSAACEPPTRWGQHWRGTGDESVVDFAMDGAGNALIVGRTTGTLDLGGTFLTGNDTDLFVVKVDANGQHVWSRLLQREGEQNMWVETSMHVDGAGNVLLVGGFTGTLRIGGVVLTSSAKTSAFVVKLSPAGAVLWARNFEGDLESRAETVGVAADSAGNVAVTGDFTGKLRIGGKEYSALLGEGRTFTMKLKAATGEPLWSRSDASTDGLGSGDIAVDAAGNVLVTGSFRGTLDLGGTSIHSSPHYPDRPDWALSLDAFVAKFEGGTGSTLWAKSIGEGQWEELGLNLRVDAAGQIMLQMRRYAWGGRGSLSWAKLDATGEPLWTRVIGGWAKDEATSIDFDASGNVLLAGTFRGEVDFGGGMRSDCGFGPPNAFLVWYRPNGEYISDKVFYCGFEGGFTLPSGAGAGFDPSGNVVFTGWFEGPMKLGATIVQAEGGSDLFLMKLDPTP